MKTKISKVVVNPYILLIISILAIAISSISFKSSNTPSSVVGMYRLYITVLIMLPFVSWKKLRLMRLTKSEWSLISSTGFFLDYIFCFGWNLYLTHHIIIAWGDIGVSSEALFGDAFSLLGTASIAAYMLVLRKKQQLNIDGC